MEYTIKQSAHVIQYPIILILSILTIVTGCRESAPPVSPDGPFYYAGRYYRNLETPFLKDQATGADFLLAGVDDDPQFRRFLLGSSGEQPAYIYLEMMGRVVDGDLATDPGERILQVDSLLSVSGSPHRIDREAVSGFYATDRSGTRATLLLNGAYGFRQTVFTADAQTDYTGQWRQLARNRVVLFYQTGDAVPAARQVIRFDPDNGQLTEEREGRQTIYKKTYL